MAQYILLTIDMLGLQLIWSTEMGVAAPFLLSLGLSKAATAAVFVAGPLSGLVVQPLIGTMSDNCRLKIGRRRPFIIIGGAICVVSLLVFGWCQEIAGWFATRGGSAHSTLAISFAVIAIWVLDFSINAVQAADRALIVDTLPASRQVVANAWATRVSGFGAVVGFGIADLDLPNTFSWLGDSQVKVLSILVSISFVVAHALTCWAVTERQLLSDGSTGRVPGVLDTLRDVWRGA